MSAQTTETQTGFNARPKRQVRNYLLDRNLQLRYTLVIVITAGILTTGLGYFWYGEVRALSRSVQVSKLESLSVDQVDEIGESMASDDHKRLLVLVAFGVVLAFVLAGLGIVFTHKIAGPLFKMQQHMRAIRHGRLVPIYELRKGDQLRAFFLQFRLMHEALGDQARAEIGVIERALEAIEKETPSAERSDPADDPVQQLRALVESKRESILNLGQE